LKSHYAPNSKVLLNCSQPNSSTYVGFADLEVERDLNLSPSGSLEEAAHNLFEFLRKADARSNGTIAIAPIPNKGIGVAINDRLQRAAAPRDDEKQEKPE
jgi:L-threonylcarbamoyladenylate synthase